MNEKNTFWESAGKAGLVLGGVSILYLMITALIDTVSADGLSIFLKLFSTVLWIAKIVGCILLMRIFMVRFAQANPEADRPRVFRFGMATALLSALLYSAAFLAYVTFIAPGLFEEVLFRMADYNPMIDDSVIDSVLPALPAFTFFFNLAYCFVFGTVVAAIHAGNIRPDNPFAE